MKRMKAFVSLMAVGLALIPSPAQALDDPLFPEQWALPQIGAPAAWGKTTGTGVRIGVVDSGIDLAHEDLAGNVVAHTTCIGSGGDPSKCSGTGQDELGHGTGVAGIAAAVGGNGKGVAGVAPNAELVVAKVADANGVVRLEDANAGIKWVVDHGARVVNVSLGEPLFVQPWISPTALEEGVDYAWSRGAVAVLAAGNTRVAGFGSYERGDLDALVVGATERDGKVADYSSPTGNAKWSLLAPGGKRDGDDSELIRTTGWVKGESNRYGHAWGTSFAAPHVAGAVALLLAQGLDAPAAVDRILATVDQTIPCGDDSPSCRGRLDVARAVGAEQ